MTKNGHTDQYISIIPMDERLKATESKASTLFKTIASKVAAETKRLFPTPQVDDGLHFL